MTTSAVIAWLSIAFAATAVVWAVTRWRAPEPPQSGRMSPEEAVLFDRMQALYSTTATEAPKGER